MASFVWGRNPQEAFDNPYEYDANEQFSEEARSILKAMFTLLIAKNRQFTRIDSSLEKAEWILLLDSVDSLQESLHFLEEKSHRISSRLFRDVVENVDLVAFFQSDSEKSNTYLAKWHSGEFVPHRISREYILETEGKEARKQRAEYYKQLSSFTHRTYKALCDSFVLGSEDRLVHDIEHESKLLVLPQVISSYYTVLADLILGVNQVLANSKYYNSDSLKNAGVKSCLVLVFRGVFFQR